MTVDSAASGGGSGGGFKTTRWSLILSSVDSQTGDCKAQEALSQLCRIYWRPIFSFLCRRGYSIPDAQDLTQDFFVMLLKGNLLRSADPNRGRFRSLLLKALQNFLIDAHDRDHAQKRGGHVAFVSWDEWMAEAPSRLEISGAMLENWSAERIFDIRWAATVAEEALRRLAEECEQRGRRRVYDVLSPFLMAERDDVSYISLARELGVGEPAIKRLLHQMRLRYRHLLREEVAQTVDNPADVDEEQRYLCAALASATEAQGDRAMPAQ